MMIGFVYSGILTMPLNVYVPRTLNFGDFLNAMPVLSGLSKSLNQKIKLVVPNSMKQIKGFRNFMEYQGFFSDVYFREECFNMDEQSYLIVTYSDYEYKDLTERPNRPIETMRHEKFVRDNYPDMHWEVDDDFELKVYINYGVNFDQRLQVCGDRWLKPTTDARRASNIIKATGLFDDETKYHFLDYNEDVMDNAMRIKSSLHPFIGTFTGSGMMADLMNKKNICVYSNDMVDPPWNGKPIEYSYWKHYYGDRDNELVHSDMLYLSTILPKI